MLLVTLFFPEQVIQNTQGVGDRAVDLRNFVYIVSSFNIQQYRYLKNHYLLVVNIVVFVSLSIIGNCDYQNKNQTGYSNYTYFPGKARESLVQYPLSDISMQVVHI